LNTLEDEDAIHVMMKTACDMRRLVVGKLEWVKHAAE